MGRRAQVAEVLAILLSAWAGAVAIPAVLMPGCGPPRGTTFLLPPSSEPRSLAVRFETVEPSDHTVLAGRGQSWRRIESGSVIRVEGMELYLLFRTPDFDGPIRVSFDVLRDDLPVGGSDVIAQVPAVFVRGDFLQVQEWNGGHPESPSRLLSLEYNFRDKAAGARDWAARSWRTYAEQIRISLQREYRERSDEGTDFRGSA